MNYIKFIEEPISRKNLKEDLIYLDLLNTFSFHSNIDISVIINEMTKHL